MECSTHIQQELWKNISSSSSPSSSSSYDFFLLTLRAEEFFLNRFSGLFGSVDISVCACVYEIHMCVYDVYAEARSRH